MSEAHRPRRLLRSIGAVLAGLVAIIILSTVTDAALHAAGVGRGTAFSTRSPSPGAPMAHGLFLFATVYRSVYSIAGSYLTARLAPYRPMRHALALGIVGVVLTIAGTTAMWGVGPVWYPLALIALAIPCAWAGGRLREMQLRARAES